jgi:hypothetical protein
MSGTFEMDNTLFPRDPLAKRWRRSQVATGGEGEPVFSDFWTLEMDFGTLEASGDFDFFFDLFTAGGLHTAILPHPRDGNLTGFTGVAFVSLETEYNDVDANSWVEGTRVVLGHISLSATGTP